MSEAEKYINEHDKEVYKNVVDATDFSALDWHDVDEIEPSQSQYALHTNLGSLTVLDRMTGFGWRDVETGFRDKDGKFWLASGNFDIREHSPMTYGDAVALVKERANTCVPEPEEKT